MHRSAKKQKREFSTLLDFALCSLSISSGVSLVNSVFALQGVHFCLFVVVLLGRFEVFFLRFPFRLQANTEILVGVKAELEEPKADNPDVGRLEFFVDW